MSDETKMREELNIIERNAGWYHCAELGNEQVTFRREVRIAIEAAYSAGRASAAEREKRLLHTLSHSVHRNHDYKPSSCSGCAEAERVLEETK